jgi:RNA-directed DNA polymerase
MKESHDEGVASHIGPESCAMVRKDQGEALTGVRAGRVWSRENLDALTGSPGSRRRLSRAEGNSGCIDSARCMRSLRGRRPRSTHGNTSHGNREIPWPPLEDGGRIGKSKDTSR